MAKIQPFRDESVKKPEDLRIRLNELVSVVNERVAIFRAIRIPDYQSGLTITLGNPGFQVGAITLGGVTPTNGASAPTSAPWVSDWVQQMDGRITCTIGGLTANKTYAVNLILFEGEATK